MSNCEVERLERSEGSGAQREIPFRSPHNASNAVINSVADTLLSGLPFAGPAGRFGRVTTVALPKLLQSLLSEKDLPQLF
jgi:hypothetical protein